jgi:hypothetical protein
MEERREAINMELRIQALGQIEISMTNNMESPPLARKK